MQDAKDHPGTPRRRRRKDQDLVRVGPLAGLVPVARELDVDPAEVLEPFGYAAAQFDDPDFEISYATATRLLARCARATQCPYFGLLVGIRASPSTLGIPGFLLQNAPDVDAALHALVQNLDLHDQGGTPLLDRQGTSTLLGYTIHQPHVEASSQVYDVAIAVACNIMRHLCGSDWNPTQVYLSRSAPPQLSPYRRFYRAPVRFNMDLNALVFPSRWLNLKNPSADALLYHHLAREANALHQSQQASIVRATRQLVRTSMLSGRCTAKEIARQLHMHERTLHRRLHAQGTSFQLQLDAIRDKIARQLLTGSSMPIVRIAATLNYSSVSAFNRAFKRWNGSTPARWRAENNALR